MRRNLGRDYKVDIVLKYRISTLLDTFKCSQWLPLSVTDSHCFDLTCNTANERARIPSLDQSQCLITVLSLRKVSTKLPECESEN